MAYSDTRIYPPDSNWEPDYDVILAEVRKLAERSFYAGSPNRNSMDLRSMPNLGEKAPDFELPDDRGRMVHLSEVTRDAVTILLFYPADFGMICSIQMEEIRGMYQDFQTFGVPVFRYLPTATVRMRPGRNRCGCRFCCWRTRTGK